MRPYELPIFVDDRAHADKLVRLGAPEHIRDGHARVMGGRVSEVVKDLKRKHNVSDIAHDEGSITEFIMSLMRSKLRGARAAFAGTDEEFLPYMNEPTDEGRTPPRLSVLFDGIPYHPNAITLEDVAEAMK